MIILRIIEWHLQPIPDGEMGTRFNLCANSVLPAYSAKIRLHRCWWRMLETEFVGDNYMMLVAVLVILVANIHYLFTLASGTNIPKMSPTSKFCHQHPKIVINVKIWKCNFWWKFSILAHILSNDALLI